MAIPEDRRPTPDKWPYWCMARWLTAHRSASDLGKAMLGFQLSPEHLFALQFDEQCKALLRAGISVVRYDILGCGRSARPRASAYGRRLVTYSPDEAYKDLQAILQQACSQDSGVSFDNSECAATITAPLLKQ